MTEAWLTGKHIQNLIPFIHQTTIWKFSSNDNWSDNYKKWEQLLINFSCLLFDSVHMGLYMCYCNTHI